MRDVPVMMLTAKGAEYDKVHGLDLGADDYLAKPFGIMELVSRCKALLRRSAMGKPGASGEQADIQVDSVSLSVRDHRAFCGGVELDLTLKEFELLQYFVENNGIALAREKILNAVWNYDYFGDARTIDTHVKKLRSKMGAKGEYIRTIWGMGYKFDPNAEKK